MDIIDMVFWVIFDFNLIYGIVDVGVDDCFMVSVFVVGWGYWYGYVEDFVFCVCKDFGIFVVILVDNLEIVLFGYVICYVILGGCV